MKLFFLIFAVAAFLLFFRLGFFPFLDYDEATFASVFSESWQSGNFLSLVNHGQLWVDKPPLLFWLMGASVGVLGQNEFAMRLPSALLGLAAILGVWLLSWQLTKDYWKSFLAGAILLSIGDFIFAARQIRMDIPVAAAILWATYFFVRGWEKEGWYLGFGMALAAGVLFKSIIGLFALPIVLIFSAVYSRWEWLKSRYFWFSIILSVLLIIPWYAYETIKFGNKFLRQLFIHNVSSRFIRTTASFLYYPKLLFQFAQPWTLVFLWALWLKKNKLAIASLFSALLIFLVFEIASTKLFYYLEPMYPFMAIFISSVSVDFFKAIGGSAKKRLFIVIFALLFLAGLASVFWQIWEVGGGQGGEYSLAREERDIGRYLNNQNFSDRVFTSNFYNYETMYYYGREKNFSITPFQGIIDSGSFFLIIPTKILMEYSLDPALQKRSKPVYSGELLTMFQVR